MMYPYMTLADDTEIVHSHVFDEDGVKKVLVHFERPTEEGFDSQDVNYLHTNGLVEKVLQMRK